MTLKQKFDSIDQSKLNSDQKDFLGKIEKATKNFTSDNKEVNDKVEGALDKMIATFKEKMPEAIKTKAEKKEPKASAKKATAKPSQTSTQKRTVMSVAKEIRKDGESWADAQKRARAEMKKDKDSATKEVKTEMDKLLAFIKTRKELEGISGTDLKRDSSREAKPRGRRISKDGNVYYENRENRIDRLAPNYPKDAPMLAGGGALSNDILNKIYQKQVESTEGGFFPEYKDKYKQYLLHFGNHYGIEIFSTNEFEPQIYIYNSELKFLGSANSVKSKNDIKKVKLSKDDFKGTEFVAYKWRDESMLAGGGDVGKKLYYERMNVGKAKYTVNYHDGVKTHKDGSAFYDIAIFKNKKDLQDFISKLSKEGYKERSSFYVKGGMLSPKERYNLEIKGMTGVSVSAIEKYIDENNLNDNDVLNIVVGLGRKQLKGADVSTAMIGKKGNAESKKLIEFVKDNKAMKMELGGNVGGYDLAGNLGGNFNIGQNDGALSGVSGTSYSGLTGETGAMSSGEMFEDGGDLSGFTGTQYSGLVGETGAMSSGEMFSKGGSVKNERKHVNHSEDYEVRYAKNNPNSKRHGYGGMKYADGGDFQAGVYAEGGSLENHGIKEGDTFVKTIAGGIQKVKDKDGNIVFINLATGERDSQPPLPFKDGGKVPEFIINKDGIRVSKMVEPKKKLSEKEWMAKHNESKEARAYKYGGKLDNYSKFIQEEFPRAKREANKYSKKYFMPYIVVVEKNNQDRIGVRTLRDFLSFPKSYQESYDVLYETKVDYAEGGEINAFSMRMVKGTNAKPDEVLTENQEVKFAGGGQVEKRQAYLDTLADKEADIWDKLGAESGGEIRQDKDMLRNYALKMEAMLKKEEVGKGSFDEADYDHFQDMNAHLMNEFLVWNNYYEPDMTVREKKWRTEKFPDSKYRHYVADPEVISLSNSNSTKADKYIVHADIKSVTVNQKGMKYTFKGSDVLNGANILEKGNVLETKAIYIPKRDVISVELKDGSEVKPSNGYWIKKDASGELFKPKSEKSESKFEVGDFVYNKRTKTIGVVRDVFDKGEVRTDADGVVNISEITMYKEGNATHRKAKIAPSTQKELEKSVFKDGGKVSFAEKSKAIAKNFKGNRVEPEYQKEYGKTYDAKEAKEVGDKIAGAQKAKYDAKAEKGAVVKRKSNNPKAGSAMVLAKEIRKDGEKWNDALKRAYEMMKNK